MYVCMYRNAYVYIHVYIRQHNLDTNAEHRVLQWWLWISSGRIWWKQEAKSSSHSQECMYPVHKRLDGGSFSSSIWTIWNDFTLSDLCTTLYVYGIVVDASICRYWRHVDQIQMQIRVAIRVYKPTSEECERVIMLVQMHVMICNYMRMLGAFWWRCRCMLQYQFSCACKSVDGKHDMQSLVFVGLFVQ